MACRLELHYSNLLYMQNLPKLTLKEDDDYYYQKRLGPLEQALPGRDKTLAQVRKHLKPNFQENIAENQIVGAKNGKASTPVL